MPQAGYIEYRPANIKLPIKVSPKSGLFHCVYAGVLYEDSQMLTLKEKVLSAIKNTYTLTWIPIIELSLSVTAHSWQETTFFSLTKERKYITHHQDFGYKQAHWTATPDGRLPSSRSFSWPAQEAFSIPASIESHGKQIVYLPYSDTIWDQIEEIEKYLLLAANKLKHGFGSIEQISTTLAVCQSLYDHFATQDESPESQLASEDE